MASTEELVRGYYAAVDSGDPEKAIATFAPDAVYDRPGYPSLVGEAIAEFYRGERVIASGAHTVEQIVVDGDRAAARGTFDGVLKSGAEAHEGFADFFAFDAEGRISARTTYFYRAAV